MAQLSPIIADLANSVNALPLADRSAKSGVDFSVLFELGTDASKAAPPRETERRPETKNTYRATVDPVAAAVDGPGNELVMQRDTEPSEDVSDAQDIFAERPDRNTKDALPKAEPDEKAEPQENIAGAKTPAKKSSTPAKTKETAEADAVQDVSNASSTDTLYDLITTAETAALALAQQLPPAVSTIDANALQQTLATLREAVDAIAVAFPAASTQSPVTTSAQLPAVDNSVEAQMDILSQSLLGLEKIAEQLVGVVNSDMAISAASNTPTTQNIAVLPPEVPANNSNALGQATQALSALQKQLEAIISSIATSAASSSPTNTTDASAGSPLPQEVSGELKNLLTKLSAIQPTAVEKSAVASSSSAALSDTTTPPPNISADGALKAASNGANISNNDVNIPAPGAPGKTVSDVVVPITGAAVASTPVGDNPSSNNNQQQGSSQTTLAIQSSGIARSSSEAASSDFSQLVARSQAKPVLEQVTFQIKTSIQSGHSKIEIRLDPAELGKLDIRLELQANGKTHVIVTADNKQTLDMLQRDASGLQRALAEAGLQADSGSMNFNLKGQQHQHQEANGRAARRYEQPSEEVAPEAATIISRSYAVSVADGVDIRI